MFKEIAEYIKQEKNSDVNIFFVPGNHDCDFGKGTSGVRNTLIESAKQSNIDEDYYKNVINWFERRYDYKVEKDYND